MTEPDGPKNARQVLVAIAVLCAVCVALGFILGFVIGRGAAG